MQYLQLTRVHFWGGHSSSYYVTVFKTPPQELALHRTSRTFLRPPATRPSAVIATLSHLSLDSLLASFPHRRPADRTRAHRRTASKLRYTTHSFELSPGSCACAADPECVLQTEETVPFPPFPSGSRSIRRFCCCGVLPSACCVFFTNNLTNIVGGPV